MHIALVANYSKTNAHDITKEAVRILQGCCAELLMPDSEQQKLPNVRYLHEQDVFSNADLIVVVGGDGTIIHTAKKAALVGKAVLGINAGRVGYLAGLEPHEIAALRRLTEQKLKIESRMMLSVCVDGMKPFYCLNDAVISKGPLSRMIDITIHIRDTAVACRADGLITATPTGSTAYSLSAGGPILDPGLESLILTPICPQSLSARPLVFRPDEIVTVQADAPDGTGAYLTIDGEQVCPLNRDSRVVIKRVEDIRVKLIKLNDRFFLEAVSEKFNLMK